MKEWTSSPLSDFDRYLFHQGTHYRAFQFMGAHIREEEGRRGVRFTVWAPKAQEVSVVGNFNDWDGSGHRMERLPDSGLWSLFIPGIDEGTVYKYEILTPVGHRQLKADPFGFYAEVKPNTASVVYDVTGYAWQDDAWLKKRQESSSYEEPMNIYEVHFGSWKRNSDEEDDYYSYRQMAAELVPYAAEMGYTHIELMPIYEHPFDGSWGYQGTGYFAATSRYGEPKDFMYFVDQCHQHGIGVLLDWVPGHFCKDDPGLRMFDGTPCYEYSDPNRRQNRGWGTSNFDLGKTEVQSYLISNALFWLDMYHIDGLRVDAVASMLYLDYEREPGEYNPNAYGGRENLESIAFLRKLNEVLFEEHPKVLMMAEESTSWPLVTKPTYLGGLGFNYKWNMGWMNDMLKYMELDPIHRKFNHNLVTFSFMYAFSENFVLPLSHDEVVHGKKSLLDKMPGDYWQKFANLRAFLAYKMAHPGKKLLFMGGEFGQFIEWRYDEALEWFMLEYTAHKALHDFVKALNHFYLNEPPLWEQDHHWEGFQWVDPHDHEQSIVSFARRAQNGDQLIFLANFTPVVRHDYRLGVPEPGEYEEVFNSDQTFWYGSGVINEGRFPTQNVESHGFSQSIVFTVPPLAGIYFRRTPTD